MSTKTKILSLLVVLVFAFTSLAAIAFVEGNALGHSDVFDTAYQVDGPLGGASAVIAGHCDASPVCSSGGG